MAPFLALALLVVQDRSETYGKSNAQILAMGHDAWYDFYTKKAGDSTMAMSGAEGLYADALGARNARLIAGRKDRKSIAALRKAIQTFEVDAVDAGSSGTGGGTMWNPIANAYYGDAETTVYRLMVPGKPAPHRVNSDVTKELALLRKILSSTADFAADWKKSGSAAMTRLEGDWKAVSALASTRNRQDSDLVLEFCRSTLKDVRETVEPK